MIVFEGEFSDELKKKVLRRNKIHAVLCMSVVTVCLCTPFIISCALYYSWLSCTLMATNISACLLLLLFFAVYREKPKHYGKLMPSKVVIEDDFMISYCQNAEYCRYFKDIKSIVDKGDSYFISFYFPDKCGTFICQKSSIKQGTIDEFENMFENKIIRKR